MTISLTGRFSSHPSPARKNPSRCQKFPSWQHSSRFILPLCISFRPIYCCPYSNTNTHTRSGQDLPIFAGKTKIPCSRRSFSLRLVSLSPIISLSYLKRGLKIAPFTQTSLNPYFLSYYVSTSTLQPARALFYPIQSFIMYLHRILQGHPPPPSLSLLLHIASSFVFSPLL